MIQPLPLLIGSGGALAAGPNDSGGLQLPTRLDVANTSGRIVGRADG